MYRDLIGDGGNILDIGTRIELVIPLCLTRIGMMYDLWWSSWILLEDPSTPSTTGKFQCWNPCKRGFVPSQHELYTSFSLVAGKIEKKHSNPFY